VITLKEINEKVVSINKPLVYVFFKFKGGGTSNIIYQHGSYFSLVDNKLLRLNPLSDVEVAVNKIVKGEYTLIGKGYLETTIPVSRKSLIKRDRA